MYKLPDSKAPITCWLDGVASATVHTCADSELLSDSTLSSKLESLALLEIKGVDRGISTSDTSCFRFFKRTLNITVATMMTTIQAITPREYPTVFSVASGAVVFAFGAVWVTVVTGAVWVTVVAALVWVTVVAGIVLLTTVPEVVISVEIIEVSGVVRVVRSRVVVEG